MAKRMEKDTDLARVNKAWKSMEPEKRDPKSIGKLAGVSKADAHEYLYWLKLGGRSVTKARKLIVEFNTMRRMKRELA